MVVYKQQNITLITRIKSINIGNQALSVALFKLLKMTYKGANVRAIERVPVYLKKFDLNDFNADENLLIQFERIAKNLASKKRCNGKNMIVKDESAMTHTDNDVPSPDSIARRVRKKIKIRKLLSTLGSGQALFRDRLAVFADTDLVIMNPAGEFHPLAVDTTLYYLLDLRCAQLCGAQTAVINTSFEIEEPRLVELAVHVLNQANYLEFRDTESLDRFRHAGGVLNADVFPDAVLFLKTFLEGESRVTRDFTGRIGVAINAVQSAKFDTEESWQRILRKNIDNGFEVELISNEYAKDRTYWQGYIGGGDISFMPHGMGFARYIEYLKGFDLIVSSRLHTCILAIVAGVRVLPFETGTFKITGFFEQLGLRELVIRTNDKNWDSQLSDRISLTMNELSSSENEIYSEVDSLIFDSREKLSMSLRALLPLPV